MSTSTLRGRHGVAAFAPLLALLAPSAALAFNPETIFLSPEAALGGGAVLAGDDRGGAGWYNPASLGGVRRSSLQLAASVYSVSAFRVEDALVTELPWETLRGAAEDTSYGSVPAVLSYSYLAREGLGFSAGIWTPFHGGQASGLGGTSSGPYPGFPDLTARYEQTYAWTTSTDDTWGSVAVGWQAARGVRLGASLQGAYSTATSVVDLDTSVATSSTDPLQQGAHVNVSIRSNEAMLAGRMLVGLQWDATPGVRLALVLRTPSYRVRAWGTSTRLLSVSALLPGYAPQVGQLVRTTEPDSSATVVDTGRISAGLAWTRETWSLRLDVDWNPALYRNSSGRQASWNLRVGVLHQLSHDLSVGAGAFREGARNLASQGQLAVDRYGLSGGVVYRPAKVIRALGGGKDWDLVTGLAGRVAYGTGKGPGMTLRPFDLSSSQLPILFDEASRGFLEVPARTFDASAHIFTDLAF